MDSNRLSSEPYFNPQQPGTVCIAIDRYGHYRPSSENALRFLQQGDVETGVRHFLDDNVKAASPLHIRAGRDTARLPFPKHEGRAAARVGTDGRPLHT